jgi:hypothetical protein
MFDPHVRSCARAVAGAIVLVAVAIFFCSSLRAQSGYGEDSVRRGGSLSDYCVDCCLIATWLRPDCSPIAPRLLPDCCPIATLLTSFCYVIAV